MNFTNKHRRGFHVLFERKNELFWQELSQLKTEQAKKIIHFNPYKAKGNDYAQNVSAIKCRMREPYRRGVSFYSYEKRMTHWKLALDVDASELFYGSYNLNHRSGLHDFEMNVLVESKCSRREVTFLVFCLYLKNDVKLLWRISFLYLLKYLS